MWMCDLEKAIPKVNECLGVDRGYVLIESIKPCADGGIAFALSDGGYIKWFPDGEVVRRGKDDWRMPPHPTPRVPSHGSIGGQMVRKMIEAHEGRMNND